MSDVRYAVVRAGGTEVTTMSVDGAVYVPMRLIVEALGINWANEHRRIVADPIMCKAVVKLTTAFSSGQEQLCLPLELFHGWLFKLNLNTINDRARPIVEALQVEGYRVLHDYWVHGAATNPRAAAQMELTERAARRRELPRLLDRLERERTPEKRRILHALIVKACEAEEIAPPAIEAIGTARPSPSDLVAPFFAALGALEQVGVAWNHSRNPARLAVNLREAATLFAQHRQPVTVNAALRAALRTADRPRFVANAPVNSGLRGRTVNCWVFEAEG